MKYRTIVADPPWPIAWTNGAWRTNGRGERSELRKRDLGYPVMTLSEIAALPVRDLAADGAHLYLWVVDRFLIDGAAAHIARTWGFDPLRLLIWEKNQIGLGTFPRPRHEIVLICRRGRLPFETRNEPSVQHWPVRFEWMPGRCTAGRVHSGKPEAFLDLVERVSPEPRLELFARAQRLGWDSFGDECLNHVEMPSVSASTSGALPREPMKRRLPSRPTRRPEAIPGGVTAPAGGATEGA